MARNIDPTTMAALAAAQVWLAVLASFQFRSSTQYCWSGVGPLVWNGMTFLGVGSLGKAGDVTESAESNAQGTKVQLSGIDPTYLSAAMTDIRQGGLARLWLATMAPGIGILGTPYMYFRGGIDKAPVSISPEGCTVTLQLESRLINHARPNCRRYDASDQHANGYPDDTAFNWVPSLIDQAVVWGS